MNNSASSEDRKKILAYLDKHSTWAEQMGKLRKILLSCEVHETVKWGSPAYTVAGTTIISLVAFKNHIALWFHQGVFLDDKTNQLINAQEGVTKALRQWRFSKGQDIDTALVQQYVEEAVVNQLAGKVLKPSADLENKETILPIELETALDLDIKAADAFANLTPGRQREYAEYIGNAKQEKTRLARTQKAVPLILAGAGLNDKYRNC